MPGTEAKKRKRKSDGGPKKKKKKKRHDDWTVFFLKFNWSFFAHLPFDIV